MFFILSKVFWFFAQPLGMILSCVVLAFLVRKKWPKIQKSLNFFAFILFVGIGFLPTGQFLIAPLENRFPVVEPDISSTTGGIIILGGAQLPLVSVERDQVSFTCAAERLTETFHLSRNYPSLPVFFTGGTTAFVNKEATEAAVTQRFFSEMGLDMQRLVLESESRNTYENALFVKDKLQEKYGELALEKEYIFVTSAFHMPRAVGVFRHAGIKIHPYPVDYQSLPSPKLQPNYYLWEGFMTASQAIKEWIGLLVYNLTGKSENLFPAP